MVRHHGSKLKVAPSYVGVLHSYSKDKYIYMFCFDISEFALFMTMIRRTNEISPFLYAIDQND